MDSVKVVHVHYSINVTYFNFTKAFDTVLTKRPLAKIQTYGIYEIILNWLASFIANDVRGFSSMANPLAGAMFLMVFCKEVSLVQSNF